MKILFICHANICRSFMAQELLKKFLPEADVSSRGVYADPAYQVPEKVTEFLKDNGVLPPPHVSAQLTKEDLERADYVFFMEARHLERTADRFAQYSGKYWLLCDYAFDKEEDLIDPVALRGRAFEKNARTLLRAVQAAAEKLRREI